MMRNLIVLTLMLFTALPVMAQDVQIDGRLQPYLQDFFKICDAYGIDYHEKLFKLESIDIVNTLTVSENSTTLGMLRRNNEGDVIAIDINWMAQLDTEILKVVAFHEFAHYFLEYSKHVCDDCGHIMSVVNSSYFDITRDWDNQLKILFEDAPAYQKKYNSTAYTVPVN